ncbi:MAG: DNA repair protein RecN [Bacteroidales bacterium]|nr:DNA repair protein RecN [Bacteroidales bacterium]MCI1733908.1 DNA repair protein RecN [Bacteroidales bacterium]
MLRKLTIQNYALIESLDIDFPDGLIIITGETGAGKSILLGAISLLLGVKADLNVLKRADKNCVVEGEFEADGKDYILRRVIAPSGRSRSFINDEPVTSAALADISSRLVDVHAQHKHLLLNDKDFQLKVLDYFSGTGDLLVKYRAEYEKVIELQEELKKLEAQIAADRRDREYREFQFKKLDEASLKEGELEELDAEQKQLANAEEIKSSITGAINLLSGDSTSTLQNLKDAGQLLEKCSNFVPVFSDLAKRIESCRIECKDILGELEKKEEDVVVSPGRLEEVENRMSDLYALLKRFNCSEIKELIAIKDDFSDKLRQTEKGDEQHVKLVKELEDSKKERERIALLISEKRREFAPKLSRKLEGAIKDLEMPNARFDVQLSNLAECSPSGKDEIHFMFTANGAERMVEIQKIASGGELSRIMLCIKKLMAEYIGMPTMIFDEIDVGVSGSIADKMGRLLSDMGKNMQIFAITHLPQIASKGKTHLLVYKEFDNTKHAQTKIKVLSSKDRIMEIARLLSGEKMSSAAVENAKVLLGV